MKYDPYIEIDDSKFYKSEIKNLLLSEVKMLISQCEEQYAERVANWHSKDAIAYFNQILLSCRSN